MSKSSTPNESTGAEVRTWLREQGEQKVGPVGSRGRFSAEQIAAFNKAHPRKRYLTPASNAPKAPGQEG